MLSVEMMEDTTITQIYFSQQACREVNHDCVASNLFQYPMWYLTCKSHIQILYDPEILFKYQLTSIIQNQLQVMNTTNHH